jgi:hypothetical protein
MNAQVVEPFPGMPPQLQEILESHPQLEGMREALPRFPPERRIVKPADPPAVDESRFVLLYLFSEDEFGGHKWINKPGNVSLATYVGMGQGFGKIPDKPVVQENGRKPERRPDLFKFIGWHVASRRFVEQLAKFDAGAITTLPIEWQFSDGSTDDYVFFDVERLVDAYDYRRSELDVAFKDGRRLLKDLNYPRALKPGAGDQQHIFRDFYRRNEILVSRELAAALVDSGMRGIRFKDLTTGKTLDLAHIEFAE